MRKIRFAVVGCGRISGIHLNAVNDAPDAELVAVCDIDSEKAKSAALKNGLSRWYTDYKKMLTDEAIDVVDICTPSGMHCEHTIMAAKKKINVLCEKPLDVTKEKIDLMIKVCKDNGVLLGGIFQRRTSDGAITARDLVLKGTLGKIVLASAYLKYYRDQIYYDSDQWRGTIAVDGGGALINQCIHGIDLLLWIAGEVKSVFSSCKTLVRDIEGEDTAVILLKFKNGALGVIEGTTSIYPGQDTILSINGENGNICVGEKGFYSWDIKDVELQRPEVKDGFGGLNCGWDEQFSGHYKQIQDMADAVMYNRQPMVTGDDARKAVDLILAAYESSRTGKEVEL